MIKGAFIFFYFLIYSSYSKYNVLKQENKINLKRSNDFSCDRMCGVNETELLCDNFDNKVK